MSDELTSSEKILIHVRSLLKFAKEEENNKLREENKGEYIQKCGNNYKSLITKYPSLFYKIIDDPENFEIERLIQMLNLKQKIDNKEISHKNASEDLGNKYYNEFVKSKIEKKD